MTITFGYFQYLSHQYLIITTIPWIINACFYIVLNYFIIRSSKSNLGEKERPELLYYIGVINIIFLLIRFVLPVYIITSPTDFDLFLEFIYVISYGLVLSLPSLITFGIFMFKYGKVNEQRFNVYLKISGILWILSFSVNVITLNGYLYGILSRFLPITSVSLLNTILGFFGLFGLIAWVLVIIHSIKNNDNDLLISGILAILAFGASYIYGIFLPILF
jgi:hypothetical protein